MIRDKNIAPDAQILLSKLQGGGLGSPLAGEVFWVAAPGSNAYDWLRGKVPVWNLLSTIDAAVGRCVAERGDTIMVTPYHTELVTLASQIDLDVAGISVIGMGVGTAMPKLDFTAAAGELAIGAPNVTVRNIRFHSNVTDVLKAIDIEALGDYFQILDCWFDVETTTTDEFTTCIHVTAAANGGLIQGNRIEMGLGGAVQGIMLSGAVDNPRILGNRISGDFSFANIGGETAASTLVDIGYNLLQNGIGGNIGTEPGIELNGNSTGIIYNNHIVCNVATGAASVVAAQCFLFENYYNETVGGAASGTLTSA